MENSSGAFSHNLLRFEGHLTLEALERELTRLGAASGRVLVDCREMTGYDADARERFVVWNRESRARVDRVAVVTEKALWHMILSTMALASGQRIRGFRELGLAEAWLEES